MIDIRALGALVRFLILSLCVLSGALASPLRAEDQNSTVFVEIEGTKVRPQPKYWAPGTADLVYGAPLTVISHENDWLKVRTLTGVEGFVNASAVTKRKVALAAGSDSVRIKADDSDVVLAGKGFNDQIESSYRAARKDLHFESVDTVQKYTVSDAELAHFIGAGKLRNP